MTDKKLQYPSNRFAPSSFHGYQMPSKDDYRRRFINMDKSEWKHREIEIMNNNL